jgi:hypothetical protein
MMVKCVQDFGIQNFKFLSQEQMMVHIQNHTTHNFESNKLHHFSNYPQKEMLIKRVQDVGIQNFEVIYEERVMAHIQNLKKHDFETQKLLHFPLILRERNAQKTRFKPAKTKKITTFFRTLEFKLLRLCMKKK